MNVTQPHREGERTQAKMRWGILGIDYYYQMVRITLTLSISLVLQLEVNFHPCFPELILCFFSRCLMRPLENLAITNCLLTESDLTHLSQCPSISQLKGLDLSGITLTHFSPYILQVLLEKVASTLQELYLEKCGIVDPQLEAILPALSHCSALTSFSVRGNLLSLAIVQKVLGCTTGLPGLCQEFYPPPRESFSSQGTLLPGRLAQVRAELYESLRALGRPRTIWISYSPCPYYGDDTINHAESIVYS